jgi:hypothetical protein
MLTSFCLPLLIIPLLMFVFECNQEVLNIVVVGFHDVLSFISVHIFWMKPFYYSDKNTHNQTGHILVDSRRHSSILDV